MSKTIGIAGAGVIGRLLALESAARGWNVSLFDADDADGRKSCTWVGAGMLAPSCELETAETEVALYGEESLARWPDVIAGLEGRVDLRQRGSLVITHPADREELERLKRRVRSRLKDPSRMKELTAEGVGELEPSLAGRFQQGVHFPFEANLDNRDLLTALGLTIKARGITWITGAPVDRVTPRTLTTGGRELRFDAVADCRGMGARAQLPELRGVRGELFYVEAPEVGLTRPVRLMHPRYPIYIVPRRDNVFVIGATAIESEDYSPVSVRSTLELLSAAYTVHSGFAEARLLETATQCRPAFPDNLPRIEVAPGMVGINGLYRHGFLLAPTLVRFACEYLETGSVPAAAEPITRALA